jgi:hypothetical protein
MKKQPWLGGAAFDSVFILLPPFICLLIVLLLPTEFRSTSVMPLAGWVVLVLCIDVAHVYSTLFRTYFDKARFTRQKMLFTLVPILCYVAGALLYSFSGMLFWRLLAYLAVFHFVRQQYGFMRLYSRTEPSAKWQRWIDTVVVYASTLLPILYWHVTPGRNFNWFVEGDFMQWQSATFSSLIGWLYLALIILYLMKECLLVLRTKQLNLPRNLLILGTGVAWYFGIVYFNGDMAFTLLNVVSHGIPYMALIWLVARREQAAQSDKGVSVLLFRAYGVLAFIGLLVLFAYFEEGLWDGLVWREHSTVFSIFKHLPQVTDKSVLALLVPLLSLPQSTHYVLDGFIWRRGAVGQKLNS